MFYRYAFYLLNKKFLKRKWLLLALVQVQKGVCMSQKITKDSLKSECCLRLSKCWHHRYRYLPQGLIEGALLHQVTRTCVDIQHPIFQQQSEPSPPGGWFCSPTALLAYTLTNISTHSYTPPTEITPFCFSRLKIKWNKKREKTSIENSRTISTWLSVCCGF